MKDGVFTKKSSGVGTVTRKIVREYETELAVINGRSAQDMSKSDWEQANWELTGGLDAEPKAALLKSALEFKRWDPTPVSTGHKMPASPSEDEDDEGRSDNERLVQESISGAEHDQMLRATRDDSKNDL